MRPSFLLFLSLFAVVAAMVVYALGVLNGHFFDMRSWTDMCPRKPLAHPIPSSWSPFPLSYRCLYEDGTSQDLVPGYVNPLIEAFLAMAVCSAAVAAVVARRRGFR